MPEPSVERGGRARALLSAAAVALLLAALYRAKGAGKAERYASPSLERTSLDAKTLRRIQKRANRGALDAEFDRQGKRLFRRWNDAASLLEPEDGADGMRTVLRRDPHTYWLSRATMPATAKKSEDERLSASAVIGQDSLWLKRQGSDQLAVHGLTKSQKARRAALRHGVHLFNNTFNDNSTEAAQARAFAALNTAPLGDTMPKANNITTETAASTPRVGCSEFGCSVYRTVS